MRTARKKTEAATDVNKKPKKRKEPDGDGRGDREEASKNDSPALQAETGKRHRLVASRWIFSGTQ